MKKITSKILAGTIGALALALPLAPLASAAPQGLRYTNAEMTFLADEAGIGISPTNDGMALDYRQPLVDLGWSALYGIQSGRTPDQQANVLLNMQNAPDGIRGITVTQAVDTVRYAISDLTGTSPSPGGLYSSHASPAPDGIRHETIA